MNLFPGFYTKMTSSFFTKILIKQAKLDRVQQRKFRDYSIKRYSMERLLNHISDRMADKNLSEQKRLNLIYGE